VTLWTGAAACGGGDLVLPSDGDPASLEVASGDDQVGSIGAALEDSVVVRVMDQAGNAVAGQQVSWTVAAGGGSVAPASSTTNDDGLAWTTWTLGPTAGPNSLQASVAGAGTVVLTATALEDSGDEGPSAIRSRLSVDPRSIEAGSGASTITVRIRDGNGDPVAGATVTLQATGNGNTLVQPATPTGVEGIAIGTLSSTEPGTKTISATVNGSVQLAETAEIVVTAPGQARIELIEGDDQTGPAGIPLPVRPAVRVLDAEGKPAEGVTVTFVVTRGGGMIDDAVQVTNAEGIARSGDWTLGLAPGDNRLEARAGSLQGSPVVFTAEGTVGGGVDHFIFRVQPHDVNKDERVTVEVAMVDADGNIVPLSGIEIYLDLFKVGNDVPSNTKVLGDRVRDTENGVAVFPMLAVTKKGTYRFRALSDELPALGPHGPEPYLFSNPFEVR